MNFTRNILFVLCFIIIITVFPSCKKTDNDNFVDEDAVVTVYCSYNDYNRRYEDGYETLSEKPVYLFAGDLQTYIREEFWFKRSIKAYDNIIYTRENAIASAVPDSEGKVVFVIDKKYLYGSVKRAFTVAIFNEYDEFNLNFLWEGISSGDNLEFNVTFESYFIKNTK